MNERLVVIEQPAELNISHPNAVRWEAVAAIPGQVTVSLDNGSSATYAPRRLRGVNIYNETSREFATGEHLHFTAVSKKLGVSNRDLGTIVNLCHWLLG